MVAEGGKSRRLPRMKASLAAHPDTPARAIESIEVDAVRLRGGWLRVRYDVRGRIDDLVLPQDGPAERTDGLWATTCFEVFGRRAGGEGYCEFNFSPSTRWAAYRFTAHRTGMEPILEIPAPTILMRVMPDRLLLHALADISQLPDLPPSLSWRLAVTAVIEETSGQKSYWALAHPQGKPDFHHAEGFALDLPTAVAGAARRFDLSEDA
jgi:hypothetical protein